MLHDLTYVTLPHLTLRCITLSLSFTPYPLPLTPYPLQHILAQETVALMHDTQSTWD